MSVQLIGDDIYVDGWLVAKFVGVLPATVRAKAESKLCPNQGVIYRPMTTKLQTVPVPTNRSKKAVKFV